MRITYDAHANAVSIRFFAGETATTEHVDEDIAIDYTEDGRIAGIEILSAKRRIGDLEEFLTNA